jgi:hypothetical protein
MKLEHKPNEEIHFPCNHNTQIHQIFDITRLKKQNPRVHKLAKITHYTNALRHLHHILVYHARISTPKERKRKKEKENICC